MSDDIIEYLEEKKILLDSIMKRYLPTRFDDKYLEWVFGKPRYSYDPESLNKAIAEPLNDFFGRGGKRWRPALFFLISELLGADMKKIADFSIIPELAHNGCLTSDTKILKNPGEYANISEIKKDDYVYSLDKDGQLKIRRVEAVKNTGNKQTYLLKTRNRSIKATGNHPFLTVNKNQPIRYKISSHGKKRLYKNLKRGDLIKISKELGISHTNLCNQLSLNMPSNLMQKETLEYIFHYAGMKLRERDFHRRQTRFESPEIKLVWKRLHDLKRGDLVVILRKAKLKSMSFKFPIPPKDPPKDKTTLPRKSTEDFCQLFGYFLGDGWINLNRRFSTLGISPSKDEAEKEAYIRLFKKVFNYDLRKETSKGYEHLSCCSFKVCWLLRKLGLYKKATEKDIPDWIFQIPEEQKLAFIRGFLDSDGTVAKNGMVSFDSSSGQLIRNLKILLDSLGFTTGNLFYRKVRNLWKNSIKKESDQWHIWVSSPEDFLKRVGTEKPEYRRRLSIKKKRRLLFNYSRPYPNLPLNLSDFRLDRVRTIKPLNIEPVYDIMVEDAHNFIAENMVVHNSIIIDDIEDLGELRRGKPCLHKLFGEDIAINAGNFAYFLPTLAFIKNKDNFDNETLVRAYNAYAQEMINIHAGQALDIWWHKGKSPRITEQQYLQMCAYKTGTLARLSARLAVILSGGSKDMEALLGRLAESLGIGFQIQDDILSATQGEFTKKKGFGDDITEGKRSLPVIHALSNAPQAERKRLLEILSMHTRDQALIKEALEILNRNGSVEYAKKRARTIMEEAWKEAKPRLPDNDAKKTLESLMSFAIERKI